MLLSILDDFQKLRSQNDNLQESLTKIISHSDSTVGEFTKNLKRHFQELDEETNSFEVKIKKFT